MIRRFGVATLLVLLLTLGFWSIRQYLAEYLAPNNYNAVESFFTALLVVLGAFAAYKDFVELLQIATKSERPTLQVNLVSKSTLRLDLMNKVRSMWLDGLLHSTVPPEETLSLTVICKPDLVISSPVRNLYELPAPERITATSLRDRIRHIFGGNFLILGTAGSGKTTLVLQLIEEILELAISNENFPIPVVFNLSSWQEGPKSFDEWLAGELIINYRVEIDVGRKIINEQGLYFFLDGLDQVGKDKRENCIEAINNFIDTHGQTRIVVSSRTIEYVQTDKKLKLSGAVEIEPLGNTEIEKFLNRNKQVATLIRKAIDSNVWFSDIIRTPLLLTIITRTYQDVPVNEQNKETFVLDLNVIYRNYIAHMLQRIIKHTNYSLNQALGWLNWLAKFVKNERKKNSGGCGDSPCCSTNPGPVYVNPNKLHTKMLPRKEEDILDTYISLSAGLIQAVVVGAIAGFLGVIFALLQSIFIFTFNSEFLLLVSPIFSGLSVGLIAGLLGRIGNGTFGRNSYLYFTSPIDLVFVVSQRSLAATIGGLLTGVLYYQFEIISIIWWAILGSLVITLSSVVVFWLAVILESIISELSRFLKINLSFPEISFKEISIPGISVIIIKIRNLVKHIISSPPLSQKKIEMLLEAPTVKFYVTRKGYLPWDLVQFLNDMTHAMILREREWGYEFIHDTLTDYFANLNTKGLNQ